MSFVKFKLSSQNARYPREADSRPGWLFYPFFDSDHLVIRPGDTVLIDCGVATCISSNNMLMIQEYLGSEPELILHPIAVADGEEVKLRLTNVSRNVCVIAKPDFDAESRLGHGIYRSAVIIPYDLPVAYGFITPYDKDHGKLDNEGMCTV